ncbi:MAG: SGNH/GDSL hydrolase family protein [Gammaproteobacteria bacterium]
MPINIICFGDSITEAAEFPYEQRWPTLLQAQLDALWPDGFMVLNRGVGGNTSAQGFDRFALDVLPFLPGILLLEFGLNDANVRDWARVPRVGVDEFRKNLREFQRLALHHGGQCVFVINHLLGDVVGQQGNNASFRDNIAPYNAALRELAVTLNTPYIDLPSLMTSQNIDTDAMLAADQLHLSAEGNRHYADMILAGLRSTVLAVTG